MKTSPTWPDVCANARATLKVGTYCSGVPGLEEVAEELGVSAAWVVGNKGELGIGRTSCGQGDPPQGVGHEECLRMKNTDGASLLYSTAVTH